MKPAVVQLANFVAPGSGGLATVVERLGRHHEASGRRRVLVVPDVDQRPATAPDVTGHVHALPGVRLPYTHGGYRMLLRRGPVERVLAREAPAVVELHDQTTLAWAGRWAREHGAASVLLAHERLDHVLGEWSAPAVRSWARHVAAGVDAVVCASRYCAEPYLEAGAQNVHHVPLGVDLDVFRPADLPPVPRPWPGGSRRSGRQPGAERPLRLALAGRLHSDKAPEVALDVVAALVRGGVDVRLTVLGAGPLAGRLRDRAARERLPVTFAGHVADRAMLAAALAGADVVVAPCPRETFGLAVLEAMACGTPVVVSTQGGARELVTAGSGRVAGSAAAMARACVELAGDPAARTAARARAQEFTWERTVAAHEAVRSRGRSRAAAR